MKLIDAVVANQFDLILRFDQLVATLQSTRHMIDCKPSSLDTVNTLYFLRKGECEGALEMLKIILSKDEYSLCWHKYHDAEDELRTKIDTYEYKLTAFAYFNRIYEETGSTDSIPLHDFESLRQNNLSNLSAYHVQSFYNEWRESLASSLKDKETSSCSKDHTTN